MTTLQYLHLSGVNPRLTSVCCMLGLAHSPLNTNTNPIVSALAVISELSFNYLLL